MSRRPGYETTSQVGYDREDRRESMTQRPGGGIGRPRGAAARATGRGQGGRHDQISDVEQLRLRLRMLELDRPR